MADYETGYAKGGIDTENAYGLTVAQYHAGVAKLWLALGVSGPQDIDVFTQVGAELERLQSIVKERAWRDATHIDPADGDEFLVAVRGSDNRTVWWDSEVVTVQIGENHFYLEVDGEPWDCDWADVAWCIPMSAMQPPEAAEAEGGK